MELGPSKVEKLVITSSFWLRKRVFVTGHTGFKGSWLAHWLLDLGAGIDGPNPRSTGEWLPRMIESGCLAECAMQGFMKIDRNGTRNIGKIIFGSPAPRDRELGANTLEIPARMVKKGKRKVMPTRDYAAI